jgi:hypothetical protein
MKTKRLKAGQTIENFMKEQAKEEDQVGQTNQE